MDHRDTEQSRNRIYGETLLPVSERFSQHWYFKRWTRVHRSSSSLCLSLCLSIFSLFLSLSLSPLSISLFLSTSFSFFLTPTWGVVLHGNGDREVNPISGSGEWVIIYLFVLVIPWIMTLRPYSLNIHNTTTSLLCFGSVLLRLGILTEPDRAHWERSALRSKLIKKWNAQLFLHFWPSRMRYITIAPLHPGL